MNKELNRLKEIFHTSFNKQDLYKDKAVFKEIFFLVKAVDIEVEDHYDDFAYCLIKGDDTKLSHMFSYYYQIFKSDDYHITNPFDTYVDVVKEFQEEYELGLYRDDLTNKLIKIAEVNETEEQEPEFKL